MKELTPDPREPKLPVWAQKALRDARHQAAHYKELLAKTEGEQEPTRVWHGDYDHKVYIPDVYAGRSSRIFFQVEEGDRGQIQARIVKDYDGKWQLAIMGGDPLTIEFGGGSNRFNIGFKH